MIHLRTLCPTASLLLALGSSPAMPAGWTITDLGIAAQGGIALNDNGWVVNGDRIHVPGAAGYTSTTVPGSSVLLRDINNANVVVGIDRPGYEHAFVWKNGTRTNLPELENFGHAYTSRAVGINDLGQVAGNTGDYAAIWSPVGAGGYTTTSIGVLLPNGNGIGSGEAVGINNAGYGVIGQVWNYYRAGYLAGIVDGRTAVPPTIFPEMAGYTPVGQAINDADAVVGYSVYNCGGYSCSKPFFWQGTTVDFLPAPASPDNGLARAINERNEVVGEAWNAPYDLRAYRWSLGASGWERTELNTLLPAGSAFYQLSVAMDINESGQIVGLGSVSGDWQAHIFLLTPIPEPHAWAMLLAGIGLVGWTIRRRR